MVKTLQNTLLIFVSLSMFWLAGCADSTQSVVVKNEQAKTQSPAVALPSGPEFKKRTTTGAKLPMPINLRASDDVQFGSAEPIVIDTRDYQPQVYRRRPFRGKQLSSSIFRPVKDARPPTELGPLNLLVPGLPAGNPLAKVQAFFPGITSSPWTPPDPSIAVGPNHVVETVNMELAFFSKDGTLEFQQRLDSTGSPGFFEDVGGGSFCFDPKCFYDHYSNRFIVLALEVYGSSEEAYITFAISDDDDPHGVWYKYRTWAVITDGTTNTWWVDYPGFGFDANGYYVTGNLFSLSSGSGFGGALFRSIDKTPLLNGGTAGFADIRDGGSASVQVAQNFGASPAPYFVSIGSSSQLKVQALTDPFTNPSLTTAMVSIPSFSGPPSAPNPGGSLLVVGSRIMNVHWRDGKLWACHTVQSVSGNRAVARWYEVDMAAWPNGPPPVLNQSGDADLGGSEHTFFPAIYSNKFGNVALVFGNSNSSENPSVQGSGRLFNDPSGTIRPPTEFVISGSGANGRWGDYFDIALDPTDQRTFWMVGEYQENAGWMTSIDSFTLEDLATPEAINVKSGSLVDGTIADLNSSDDEKVEFRPRRRRFSRVEFDSTSTSSNPKQMWFSFEYQVDAQAGDVVRRKIELYDFATNSWEEIDSQLTAQFNNDIKLSFELDGDLSRFVESGTNKIRSRLTFSRRLFSPFDFAVFLDHVEWLIAE